MAQLPVYNQQRNITTQEPAQVRDINTYAQGGISLQNTGNALYELTAKWQASKDAVENLDGKNKLMSGITSILDEASNYNDYKTPEELSQKQQELTKRMNSLVPDIVSGFSNNQKAREFEMNGQFATQQNIFKLQDVFRQKYGDMYNANLQQTADSALRNYTKTGNESFKQEYFDAIETGIQAGYLDREQAEKLKLDTNEWNYNYVYSQILDNPYFKASDEVMSKINPIQQRTLRNFQRTEQKRAQAEAAQAALNNFCLNPTDKNLKKYYQYNPSARGSKDLENMVNTPMKFNTTTTFEGMSDALYYVKTLANMDVSTPEKKKQYMYTAAQIGWTIKNSNGLSPDKKQKLFNMIYKDMMDDNFKNQLKNMPDLAREWNKEFVRDYPKLNSNVIKAQMEMQKYSGNMNSAAYKKAEANYKKAWNTRHYYMGFNDMANKNRKVIAPEGINQTITNLQREASAQMLDAYMSGNVKKANQIKEQYEQNMIRVKYWNVPALQNKNIKVGDKFTVNGKVYSYQGFSKNDVIVEVH